VLDRCRTGIRQTRQREHVDGLGRPSYTRDVPHDVLAGRIETAVAATLEQHRADLVERQVEAELERQLGPREDRDASARILPNSGADAIPTSIAKACKAAGIPLWSPHDLRHRRISLLHLRGVPWARIGEHVGQRSLKVTADLYTHVLSDETELDYGELLR
jgi:hypothetical protein